MTDILNQKEMKVIVFQLMDMEYAIDVDIVQSIEKVLSITRVPKTPAYVKGVINLEESLHQLSIYVSGSVLLQKRWMTVQE